MASSFRPRISTPLRLWRRLSLRSSSSSSSSSPVTCTDFEALGIDSSDARKDHGARQTGISVGTSAPPSPHHPDHHLLKALKEQLDETLQCIMPRKSEVSGSFHPFEIVRTEGSSSGLMLRRNLRDEEIIVTCVLEIEEPDDAEYLLEDNEDELNLIQHLSMNVQIKKAAQGDEARFLIVCHYVDQSVTIEDVMCIGKSEYIQSDHPYSGPVFSKLSERLQKAFYEVIKEKGIDVKLADLAIAHLTSNYQDESVRWLRNVRKFLKKRE